MTVKLIRFAIWILLLIMVMRIFFMLNKVNNSSDNHIMVSTSDIEVLYETSHITTQYLSQQIDGDSLCLDSIKKKIEIALKLLRSNNDKLDSIYLSY